MRRMIKLPALSLLLFGLVQFSCGGVGEGDQDGNKAKKPKEGPVPQKDAANPDLKTNVGLGLLSNEAPLLVGCSKPDAIKFLMGLNTFILDGNSNEWPPEFLFINDPNGDGRKNSDLTASYLAFSDQNQVDLVGFLQGPLDIDENHQVELSFGSLSERESEEQLRVGPVVQRLYRFVRNGIIEERIGAEWQPLPTSTGRWKSGKDGIEWTLNRRQLDEVLLQTLWFHQVKSKLNDEVEDETSLRFVPSTLGGGGIARYSLSTCTIESGDSHPFTFQQIIDSDLDADMVETLLGIARKAFESIQQSWRHTAPWPTNLLTLYISKASPMLDNAEVGADHRRTLYDGYTVQWNETLAEDLRFERFESVFSAVQLAFLHGLFKYHRPMANLGELAWATFTANHWATRRYLGYANWIVSIQNSTSAFRAKPDGSSPVGVLDLYDRLSEPFPTPDHHAAHLQTAAAKASAGAAIASLYFNPQHILTAWRRAGSTGSFPIELTQASSQQDKVDQLWRGWLRSEPYDQEWGPNILDDNDHDGLLNFLEKYLGSNVDEIDSDSDGWSDLGELLVGSPFANRSRTPGVIVADGYFGDWQELLPTHINAHESKVHAPVACGPEAKIQATAAIGKDSHLILVALPRQVWGGGSVISWEFQVDFPREGRQLILIAKAGTYIMEVLDTENLEPIARIPLPMPVGRYATELALDVHKVGLSSDLSRPRTARYRLTTILENGERVLCDQTPWIYPLVNMRK